MNFLSFLVLFVFVFKLNADYEWMYHLPYGSDVTLKPLKKSPNDRVLAQTCEWITPTRVRLRANEINQDFVRHVIDPTRCELKIFNIQKSTNGIYHCVINSTYITKAMLNYHGPPYASFYDEYKWNFVAGISTSACILIIFFMGQCVFKHRYREQVKDKNGIETAHSNEAYTLDQALEDIQISKF